MVRMVAVLCCSIPAAISAANCALRVLRFCTLLRGSSGNYTVRTVPQKHGQEVCLYTSTILFYSLFYRLRRMGYLCARRQRLTNVELGSRAFQGLLNHPYAGVRAPEYAPHGPFNLL